jgi:hypothetical protein
MISTPLVGIVSLAAVAAEPEITFNKHIAPIVWKNCAGCHRPGEVGPFSLLTYKDAAKRAGFLKEVTTARRMPPWKAERGYGEFHDARILTDAEIELIADWADSGAKEGAAADLPPPPTFPDGWQLGTPDLILKMPEEFEIPASGRDVFRCFVIPTEVTENRSVAAVEFRPGNRKVVHHALLFLESTGAARKLDAADPEPGYGTFGGIGVLPTGSLGGWAPGTMARKLPEGLCRRLAKGADLVMQVHYHPSGKVEKDQSSLGIYFTKLPNAKPVVGLRLVNRDIQIPPGEKHYVRTAIVVVPADVKAIGIFPHMHWLGKDIQVKAVLPSGKEEPLIWIKDWDFNWQGDYTFAKPIALPKGTRLELTAVYDNSAENPRNPNQPPKLVRFGEQTTDEMCLCGVQLVPDRVADYVEILRALRPFGQRLRKEPAKPSPEVARKSQ